MRHYMPHLNKIYFIVLDTAHSFESSWSYLETFLQQQFVLFIVVLLW